MAMSLVERILRLILPVSGLKTLTKRCIKANIGRQWWPISVFTACFKSNVGHTRKSWARHHLSQLLFNGCSSGANPHRRGTRTPLV